MEKKQHLQGKLTYISLAIGALTVVFQFLGKEFPAEEANALANWADTMWPELVKLGSIVMAFWGRLRREFRAEAELEEAKHPTEE